MVVGSGETIAASYVDARARENPTTRTHAAPTEGNARRAGPIREGGIREVLPPPTKGGGGEVQPGQHSTNAEGERARRNSVPERRGTIESAAGGDETSSS